MASLEQIKLLMKDTPVTAGWGAIAILSHAAINTALQQTILQRLRNNRYMLPLRLITGDSDRAADQFEATGIVFGTPQLSFQGATLADARVGVTLPIIAGHYVATHRPLGAPATITGSGIISEAHGRSVQVSGQLNVAIGYADGQARVFLDLAKASQVQTNLAGEDEATNLELAALIKQQFDQGNSDTLFMLAKFNCIDYTNLSPAYCEVRTQESDNPKFEGDGAVVILIQLLGELGRGDAVEALPYLIPDDTAADGAPLYTATLVVAQAVAGTADSIPVNLTDNTFYPNGHVLWGGRVEKPHDLAHFGNLVLAMDTYTVAPADATVVAGNTLRFSLLDWQGNSVTADNWSVRGQESHTAASHGTIDANGLYTAPSVEDIGHDSLQLVVTAKGNRNGVEYLAQAKAVVTHERSTVAPQLATQPTQARTPIQFSATAGMGWHLTGQAFGTLQGSGNQARFTFDEKTTYPALVVQTLEARNGSDTRQAAAMRCNGQPLYAIGPPHATLIKKRTTTTLLHDATFLNGASRRWKVRSGSGTVDQQGVFTAPGDGLPASNLVQCELVHNGVVFATGYSVLDTSERKDELTWQTLEHFQIKVPGSPDEERGTLVANGYQQLYVTVYVKTTDVVTEELIGGVMHKAIHQIPISSNEQASMRLAINTQKQPLVLEDYEGIDPQEEEPQPLWRTRSTANFLYSPSTGGDAGNQTPLANNETTLKFYVHSRAGVSAATEFKATFLQDPPGNATQWSDQKTGSPFQAINVATTAPASFEGSNYTWPKALDTPEHDPNFPGRPVRVWTGDLPSLAAPEAGNRQEPPPDPNDYHFNTIDYWALNVNNINQLPKREFWIVQFITDSDRKPIHLSMLEWESETYGEEMASYTGIIFYNPPRKKPPVSERKEKFDGALKVINPVLNLDTQYFPASVNAGDLIVTLHRRDDFPYKHADRDGPAVGAALAKIRNSPIHARVLDNEGDVHFFTFSFPDRGLPDHRNTVHISYGPW